MKVIKIIVYILSILCLFHTLSVYKKCNSDVTIAGLFPIREKGVNVGGKLVCDGRVSSKGIQEALAMIYAVHLINEDPNLLPNISLGVDMADSCSNNEIAIRNSLQFHFVRRNTFLISSGYHFTPDTVAVVGLRKSSISKTVSTLTNLFKVPTISYGSTDHKLSNKDVYPTFARTIPSNLFLGKALITLLRTLRWNIVYAVYDKSDYGLSAFQIFQEYLTELNEKTEFQSGRLCIADVYEFEDFIGNIKSIKKSWMFRMEVSAVILFVHMEKGTQLLQNVFFHEIQGYTWVFSEGINYSIEIEKMFKTSRTGNNVISIQPKQFPCQGYRDFVEKYFSNEQLQELIPGLDECARTKCLLAVPEFSNFIPYVIDAVNVIAHALHTYYGCQTRGSCEIKHQTKQLMEYVHNVSFESQLGYEFKFNANGDVFGQYEINLLQEQWKSKRRGKLLHKIGLWDSKKESELILNVPIYTFRLSSCYILCPEGFGVVPRKEYSQCCSECFLCEDYEYTNNETYKCEKCKSKFFIPNRFRNGCIEMKLNTISYGSKVGLAIITVSTIGVVFIVFITVIFLIYRDTHFVRASSFDLSLLMLFGCTIGFASPHLTVGKITSLTCRMNVLVSGTSMSLIVGTLFVKTNRIYRIFSKKILKKGVRFLSRKSQLVFIGILTSFSCVLSIVVGYFPTEPIIYERIVHVAKKETYASCRYATKMSAVWWAYNTIMIVVCTYQAIIARKLPDNYNEARCILFAMMSISVEMFFLVPGFYYGLEHSYKQLLYTVINVVSASSTIFFMFLPKIYLILCRPEENKEQPPHGNLGDFDCSAVIENVSVTEFHSPCKRRKLEKN